MFSFDKIIIFYRNQSSFYIHIYEYSFNDYNNSLRNELGNRWNGLLYVAEDSAILDASMDSVSEI